jgi:raffinose/stachyose/melibiose transport system permease protein
MSTAQNSGSKLRRTAQVSLLYVPLVILSLYALWPLFILLFNALKTTPEIIANPFLPSLDPQWHNFVQSFQTGRFGHTLLVSLFLVGMVVPCVLLIAFPAAYILAREKSVAADAIIVFLLVLSTFPPQLYIIPLFVFLSQNGLLNNIFVLAVVYIAKFSPFAVFLLRAFLLRIPEELDEAARLDGASELRMMLTVLAPAAKPVLMTVALITGLNVWNEFILAATLIQDPNLKPVSTSLYAFRSQYSTNWPLTNAGAIISAVLPIALFLLLQRRFIEGLTSGAVK